MIYVLVVLALIVVVFGRGAVDNLLNLVGAVITIIMAIVFWTLFPQYHSMMVLAIILLFGFPIGYIAHSYYHWEYKIARRQRAEANQKQSAPVLSQNSTTASNASLPKLVPQTTNYQPSPFQFVDPYVFPSHESTPELPFNFFPESNTAPPSPTSAPTPQVSGSVWVCPGCNAKHISNEPLCINCRTAIQQAQNSGR